MTFRPKSPKSPELSNPANKEAIAKIAEPTPQAIQLELLAPSFFTGNHEESRTLDLFDAIPKYPYQRTRVVGKSQVLTTHFDSGGVKYTAKIMTAQIEDPASDKVLNVFAGGREQLVEQTLRYLATQQRAHTKFERDAKTNVPAVTVFFTLSQVRRHLAELSHQFKISEIKEALAILARTEITIISPSPPDAKGKVRVRHLTATILSNYTGDMLVGDKTGEESKVAMTFHPLATEAILDLAYYPINERRVNSLKISLARWLTMRLSHNFRQAKKFASIENFGYHISLRLMLEQHAIEPGGRLRDRVRMVREALSEMHKSGILDRGVPFKEDLKQEKLSGVKRKPSAGGQGNEEIKAGSNAGRKRIIDAVWTLFPSNVFAEEIIVGNKTMRTAKDERSVSDDDGQKDFLAIKAADDGRTRLKR
jgi:hypothetical protein